MKKVLSFVLVLSMILGSFGMAFAAAPADVVGKDYEDAVNVLMELGVVDGYKDGTYRPENIVTRAEAATLIIKAMGLNDYAVGKSSFSDMAGHWADPYVAYAASLGFVAGNTDGTFAPNAPVTSDQMITMLVQAVGYKAEYLVGGYPGAFVNQAKALGMLDGVKSGAAGCTRADVAVLLFNTLDVDFARYSTDGVLQETIVGQEDNMLKRLGAEIYTPDAKVSTIVDAKEKTFVVNGSEDAVINLKEYQGAVVKAYANADGEIIAMKEVVTVFVKGDFDKKDKTFTTTDEVEYKFKEAAEKATVDYFKNGAADGTKKVADLMAADTEGVVLAVKTSGKYITAVYSAAEWKEGVTVLWTEKLGDALAEDDLMNKVEFAMTDDDEIDMDEVVLAGVASLEDIKEDDIVTYYVANKKVVKVEVGTEKVEGKVTKESTDAKEVTIGGKVYDVVRPLLKDSDKVELTAEGTFFLNFDGDIVYAEAVSTEAKDYAVVTVANAKTGDKFDGEVMKIKMVTEDGKEAIYVIEEDYAKKVASYKENDVIAYNLDKNGEIDKIEAVTTYAAVKLTAKGFLDGYKVVDDVVVFEYDGEDYTAATLADVPVNEKLGKTVYGLNSDKEVVVIILDSEAGDNADSVYGVYVDAGKVENADEKVVYAVDMLVDGEAADYLTNDLLAKEKMPVAGKLYELIFDGSDIAEFKAVKEDDTTTVAGIKDGNIKLSGKTTYTEVAADVVVYLLNKDGKMEAADFDDIEEEDTVWMFELDNDEEADSDEDGVDVIIFKEA